MIGERVDSIGSAGQRNWPVALAVPLGVLVAAASLAGILLPASYANETAEWAAQGVAQDWIDLVVAVPLLVVGILLTQRRQPFGRSLLLGTAMFLAYSFAIYAFDIHFNQLFLIYCAILGLSAFCAGGLALPWLGNAALPPQPPVRGRRLAGWFLVTVAIAFGLLWLAMIVPPTFQGSVPAAIKAVGLPTNPVHVLDLSLFLPAQVIVGISLLRGRTTGIGLAPAFLVFGAVMATNLAALAVASRAQEGSGLGMAAAFVLFALVEGVVLADLRPNRGQRVLQPDG